MIENPFSTVKFNSTEYILGLPPEQNYNLADILMSHKRPFGLLHAPELKQGRDTYETVLWDGDDDTVWMGVNHNPYSGSKLDEPRGLFYLDRRAQRVLYDPKESIPLRDSYRGFYENNFGTTAKLADLVKILADRGLSFYQITSLLDIPNIKTKDNSGLVILADSVYHSTRPNRAIFKPFRMEGLIDPEQILAGNLIDIKPLNSDMDNQEAVEMLAKDW